MHSTCLFNDIIASIIKHNKALLSSFSIEQFVWIHSTRGICSQEKKNVEAFCVIAFGKQWRQCRSQRNSKQRGPINLPRRNAKRSFFQEAEILCARLKKTYDFHGESLRKTSSPWNADDFSLLKIAKARISFMLMKNCWKYMTKPLKWIK